MQKLIVIGAGGFGRETLDVVEAINAVAPTFELLGVIDADPNEANLERLRQRRVEYLGTDEGLINDLEAHFVVAIGSPRVREVVSGRMLSAGAVAATLVHPAPASGVRARSVAEA
jgi:CO dehydrogenase nickel-insertion accessory protein CooC1